MANDQQDFELWLKSRFDGDALKAAEAGFRQTQRTAKETGTTMDELGYSAKNLKTALVEIFAATEIIAQFKEGFEQVAALEQAMNQLERATKRNGDSFEEVKGKIVGMANALKKAAGVDDDAAIKKMSELYNATGDVANAMNLVALATDVAIGAGMDFERANDLVTRAAMGQTRGLKELQISIEETGDKTKNADLALAAIRKNFGGAANDAKGLAVEINRLNEQWEDSRNTLVEKLTPAVGIAIKSVQSFFTVLDGLWAAVGEIFVRTGAWIGGVVTAIGKLWKGDIEGAKAALRQSNAEIAGMFDYIVEQAAESKKKVDDIWAGKGGGGVEAGPAKNIVSGGGGTGGDQGDGYDPVVDDENFRQEQLRKLREKIEDERLKSEADFQKNVTKLRVYGQREALRMEKELTAEMEDQTRARTRLIVEEVRMKRMAAEMEKAARADAAFAAIALGRQVFGESKALSIAEAILSTYQAAAGQLAMKPVGPWNIALAAIMIASGLAQVAKIASTEPSTQGSGFDSPSNDRAAYIGGRRWAADMIGEFTKGVSSGWASGMGAAGGSSTTTYDNRRTVNVHMHGTAFMDPSSIQQAKQFKRTLDVVDRTVDSQRTIARARG